MNKKSLKSLNVPTNKSTRKSVWNCVYFSVYFCVHRCTLRPVEDIVHDSVKYNVWHSSVRGLIDDGLNRPIQTIIESASINYFKTKNE